MTVRSRASGFTLIEVVFAFSIIVVSCLALTAALASSEKMSSTARERVLASNAIRAYIEALRHDYPSSQGSADMSGFLYDNRTPADFVPTSGREASALRDARGLVLKMTDETGRRWGPAAIGTPPHEWQWTDATGATSMTGCPTSAGSVAALGTASLTYPTFPTPSQLASLGMVNPVTNALGFDLDGSGVVSNGTGTHIDPLSQRIVPCEITLSWLSGSGSAVSRQRITIYASFGPEH